MGEISGGGFSLKKHTLSQHYCDFNNCDVCIIYVFKNICTLLQFEDSSSFKKIDDDAEKGDCDVSSGYGF